MRTIKAFIVFSTILGLVAPVGCRMCASPHDSCGPVISGGGRSGECSSARAGSAFAATRYSEQTNEEVPGYTFVPHVLGSDSEQVTVSPSRGPLPRYPHRPLTREDLDPFLKLGIPAENIISVTDRPADETVAQETSPSPQASARVDSKEPKPLGAANQEVATSAGWTRIGERTSATRR